MPRKKTKTRILPKTRTKRSRQESSDDMSVSAKRRKPTSTVEATPPKQSSSYTRQDSPAPKVPGAHIGRSLSQPSLTIPRRSPRLRRLAQQKQRSQSAKTLYSSLYRIPEASPSKEKGSPVKDTTLEVEPETSLTIKL